MQGNVTKGIIYMVQGVESEQRALLVERDDTCLNNNEIEDYCIIQDKYLT